MSIYEKYVSTIFMCETSKDNRYIRCDFKQCSKHMNSNSQTAYEWMLNTVQNVTYLERHVGDEICNFIKSHENCNQRSSYELNTHLISDQNASFFPKKLLITFNLRDTQSSLGIWINAFLEVCRSSMDSLVCITLSFGSRKELLSQINLFTQISRFLAGSEVLIVLSCHSSSQGQVFSCTPVTLSELYGFEEFCSLHDFVCACQDIFGEKLKVIHISSCFALKLDESHIDWPVHYSWLKEKLSCTLSGSAKEVYETGSQTADLYLILHTLLSEKSIANSYKHTFENISMEMFPDLVMEMGLNILDPDTLESMILNPCKNNEVTPRAFVECALHLAIVFRTSDGTNRLKHALMCNLQTRVTSDFKMHIHNIDMDFELVKDIFQSIDCSSKKIFVLVLALDCENILNDLWDWLYKDEKVNLYGIHISFCKSYEQIAPAMKALNTPITFMCNNNLKETTPLLIYIVQLCLGENGSKDVNHTSSWSLQEVYEEVNNVLPGLCKNAQLKIHTPLSNRISLNHIEMSDFSNQSFQNLDPQFNFERNISNHKLCNLDSISNKSLLEDIYNPDVALYAIQSRSANDVSSSNNPINETKDIPFLANVDEVLVSHYALNLDVLFHDRCVIGSILLFVKPANETASKQKFQMCLDCTLITIHSVEKVELPQGFQIHFHKDFCCCLDKDKDTVYLNDDQLKKEAKKGFTCDYCRFLENSRNASAENLKYQMLSYSLHGWCIRVWDEETTIWPKCIRIKYRTNPMGPSLMWCKDQDGNLCGFTPGAYINNRSLMPCQEPPIATSTWQAFVYVPSGYTVLSSGEIISCKQKYLRSTCQRDGFDLFYFEMSMPLPSSTLAFIFGKLAQSSKSITVTCPQTNKRVAVSLYATTSKIDDFEKEYLNLSSEYLVSTCEKLGSYPFSRLDIVLMPPPFACMGLQSPNIMFLSQSVLCGDRSMSSRIAHEISHCWFGLMVGAEDWTEEWLSEGFATYMEDRIVAHHQNMSQEVFAQFNGIIQILREKVLKGELNEIDDDNLKLLRPKKTGKFISGRNNKILKVATKIKNPKNNLFFTAMDAIKNCQESNEKNNITSDACISSKKWSQVHYLKGYFLLLHLSQLVGVETFDEFLKKYLEYYSGKLVSSEMFLDYFSLYYNMKSDFKEKIASTWLDSTNIPEGDFQRNSNPLLQEVDNEYSFWKVRNATNKRLKTCGFKRKMSSTLSKRSALNNHQLVLVLEYLLQMDGLLPQTLTQLNQCFKFKKRNAEVRHRWCELIVKHNHLSKFGDVKDFLINDQGMGIYLYGELILSGNTRQKKLADEVFQLISSEMDNATRETVRQMIYPE